MRIGVTGHQERAGIDWAWVRTAVEVQIRLAGVPVTGLSSLAVGADQVFAQAVLDLGGSVVAVVPRDDYEGFFQGEGLARYHVLLARSERIDLKAEHDEAFLDAGLYIVDHCDLLLSIWDGLPSRGKGGTADVVAHARATRRSWVHIEPVGRTVVLHAG